MKSTLGLSCVFVLGCTGGDPDGDQGNAPHPTDIVWPEDDSIVDVISADGVAVTFFLSRRPIPGTVEVRVDDDAGAVTFFFTEAQGDPPVGDFTYDAPSNSVRFLRYVPPLQSDVIARYEPLTPPSR